MEAWVCWVSSRLCCSRGSCIMHVRVSLRRGAVANVVLRVSRLRTLLLHVVRVVGVFPISVPGCLLLRLHLIPTVDMNSPGVFFSHRRGHRRNGGLCCIPIPPVCVTFGLTLRAGAGHWRWGCSRVAEGQGEGRGFWEEGPSAFLDDSAPFLFLVDRDSVSGKDASTGKLTTGIDTGILFWSSEDAVTR